MCPPKDLPEQIAKAHRFCFEQREVEAAELVASHPFDSGASQVHDLLATHFASREAMANKLGVNDPVGAKWSKKYGFHPNYIPRCFLTAAIIVKNEELHISRCLKSLQGVADEIVLIDTGSTDRTLSIVRFLDIPHLKLGKFEWVNDFSKARNYALDRSNGDWVLWIDADEELTSESIPAIQRALVRPQFGGYNIKIINYTDDYNDRETYTHSPIRLFKHNKLIRFEGKIHEQIGGSIEALGLKTASLEGATLRHYGYRPSEMVRKEKIKRFLTMLEQEVKENPSNGFHWFNLANTYCVAERLEEQEHAAKMAVKLLPDNDQSLPLAFQLAAAAQTALGKPDEALATLDHAKERGIDDIFSNFERSNALITVGRFEDALEAINRALEFKWTDDTIGDYTLFLYKRHVVKGQILIGLGKYKEAEKVLDKALKVQPEFPSAVFHRASALLGQGKFDQALPEFQRLSQSGPLVQPAMLLTARCYLGLEKWSESAQNYESCYNWAPDSFSEWSPWAEAAEKSKDAATIARAFGAFAAKPEEDHSVLINWGRCLASAGDHQRALECFSDAIKLAPEDPNGYFNCGDLLYQIGQFRDAAHLYQSALQLDPKNPEGWFVLGNSLAMLDIKEGAEIAYTEAIKQNPQHQKALHNLESIRAA